MRTVTVSPPPSTPTVADASRRTVTVPPRAMKKFAFVAILLVIGATAFSVACLKGGFIHFEAEKFIPHYLSPKPLAELIFAPGQTDWGLYQARELSYLFDWMDCRFIAWSAARGLPHFLSITHYLLGAMVALGIAFFAKRGLRLSSAISLALMGLWLTNPCVLLGGVYYRSAKIVTAAALLGVCIAAWHYLHEPKSSSVRTRSSLALAFLFLVCAGLADRQGFFLIAAFGLWLGLRAWWLGHKACWRLAVAGFLATGAILFYTYLIGPWLIHRIDGHPPSLDYMTLPWEELAAGEGVLKYLMWYAPRTTLYTIGTAMGGLPWMIALGAMGWAVWYFSSAQDSTAPRPPKPWLTMLWWFLPLLGFFAMYALMALRHRVVVQLAEFQIIYYPLPLTTLAVVVLTLGIASAYHGGRASRWALAATLWLLVASNIGNLPQYRLLYATGVHADEIAAGPNNLALLRARMVPPDAGPALQALRHVVCRPAFPQP
jgi:hypothetical protein